MAGIVIRPLASRLSADAPWNTLITLVVVVISNVFESFYLRGFGISPHKTTLFHTVAHFRGCFICGQVIFGNKNAIFLNEVNDLARFVRASHRMNVQKNEGLIAHSEGDVSAIYMCLRSRGNSAQSRTSVAIRRLTLFSPESFRKEIGQGMA
ncbi:MAG TPA: hypothetical protein VGE08_16350 [Steroidobacter sp.]|uniref:hypothetical protein n=1 Tax=Steroidobacter sp. TaxID=1978227 RepID=UPI002ED9B795